MTVVGTLRKNTSEIPALFLSGKQCPFFYLWFYQWFNTGIICTSKKQDCHPPFITASWWYMHGGGKRSQTWNIMHDNATKSGVDVLDKLVKEYTCTRLTRCWTFL
jgi:hypothetical protein